MRMRNSASAVLCKMASEYNERFSYSDPLHRHSSSRTTRYRLRKKRQLSVNTRGPSNKRRSLHGLSEDAASAESLADDLPDVDCTEDVDGRVFPDEIETECENINDSAEDITVDNSDSETEDSSVWQYEFDSDGEGAVGQNTSENDMAVTVLKDQQCMSERAATMLYEGSSLTVACSSIMMMNLKMKHNLTDTCVEDILKLIKFHCPTPNNCVRSVYLLKKFFQESKYPVVYHYYCDKCYTEVCNSDSVCPNMCCKQVMTSNEGKSSFIEVPIEDQLKNLLGRRGMCELIKDQASFLRSGRSQGSDICGGKLYQELCSKGVMQGNCVALIVNIDGVPVFRSSGYQFWPIFIMICELPYRMRIAKENRIFGGLWYGTTKPDMSLFLKPLANALSTLVTNGVEVPSPNSEACIFKAYVICTTMDLPAKAAVLNVIQFNGYWGCNQCLQKGGRVECAPGTRGTVQVYPYDEKDPCGPSRDHKHTLLHAQEATSSGKPVYGIKGPSWLSTIPHYDLIRGTSVDYMHCVLLGVSKQVIKLWTQSKYHKELWYIGNSVDNINQRLLAIKPPCEIQRTPRSLEYLKYWKAHEFRTFLLHYSPVVLHNVLPSAYYQHHLLLVEGVFLLLRDKVTLQMIQQSRQLLQHYCFMFSHLYGLRNMSSNVHNLLHLPKMVDDLGPLWAHSCFPFESAIGELLKLFHGSQGIEKQVVGHINTLQTLPYIAESTLQSDTAEENFYQQLNHKRKCSRKEGIFVTEDHTLLGSPKYTSLTQNEIELFAQVGIVGYEDTDILLYSQLLLNRTNRVVSAEECSKATKRNDSCISVVNCEQCRYGLLKKLFVLRQSQQSKFYSLVMFLRATSLGLCEDHITHAALNQHILAFQPPRSQDYCIIPTEQIKDKCLIMEVQSTLSHVFVSVLPNSKEVE